MEVECVKVSRLPQPPSESWGPAGHRGTVPSHETWAVIQIPHRASLHSPHCLKLVRYRLTRHLVTWNTVIALHFFFIFCVSIHLPSPHHAEYYLHEAKRMKHRADAMVSPWSLIEYKLSTEKQDVVQSLKKYSILGEYYHLLFLLGVRWKVWFDFCVFSKQANKTWFTKQICFQGRYNVLYNETNNTLYLHYINCAVVHQKACIKWPKIFCSH